MAARRKEFHGRPRQTWLYQKERVRTGGVSALALRLFWVRMKIDPPSGELGAYGDYLKRREPLQVRAGQISADRNNIKGPSIAKALVSIQHYAPLEPEPCCSSANGVGFDTKKPLAHAHRYIWQANHAAA